jgi:hypothetical protein
MGRWDTWIENLLADLEMETPGAKGFRVNVDRKIAEAEDIAANKTPPARFDETLLQRKREFQDALRQSLVVGRDRDLANKVWSEALLLLDNPWLRVPDKKRPKGRGPQAVKRASKRGIR